MNSFYLTKLDCFLENDSSVGKFALLVARVREDKKLVNAFARFARQICDSRECWFRQLSSEATKQQFANMLEMRFIIHFSFSFVFMFFSFSVQMYDTARLFSLFSFPTSTHKKMHFYA